MLVIYYAHGLYLYNTLQEQRDIKLLEALGFEVLNPNTPEIQNQIKELKKVHGEQADYMEYFRDMVKDCDIVAFRALPDGRIGAGVYTEVECAYEENIPVFELPSGFTTRKITVEATREYLKEIGQR